MKSTFASLLLASAAASYVVGQPTITLNTTTVTHLSWVEMTYSGLPVNDAGVWFGVFYPYNASTLAGPIVPYPATAPFVVNQPVKWIYCSSMPGCMTSGAGTYNFQLINSFTDCKIVAFKNDTTYPIAIASSPRITFSDVNIPLRGHLGRTRDATSMKVIWHSPFNNDNPQVTWGTTPSGPYPNVGYAESQTYFRDDLCGEPATSMGWFTPYYWNYATITNLTAGSSQIIYYIYGSQANGWSEEESFIAPPLPNADTPVHIVAIADSGVTESDGTIDHWDEPNATLNFNYLASTIRNTGDGYMYSLGLHVGDLSYATGALLKWDLFLTKLSGVFTRIPYQVAQGNHERDWPGTSSIDSYDSGGECGIPTQIRFPSPTSTSHFQDEGFYSIIQGSALIIMLNSEFEIGPGSTQYTFLNQTLTAIDRSITPWSIVAFHRPMYYVDDSAAGGAIDAAFQVIEDVLFENKVDLVLVGHVHNAYASCPVYKGSCVAASTPGGYDAPTHVSIGNGGQGISPINPTTYPAWVRYQKAEWGYTTLHIWNSTDLSMDLYGDDENTLRYSVEIHRNFPRGY